MNTPLVDINLHGELGEKFCPNWKLAVSSVGEALHAINTHKKTLLQYLMEKGKENIQYHVLVNGLIVENGNMSIENPETIINSELNIKRGNIKTIDIIPLIEGADAKGAGIGAMVLGALLIVVGAVVSWAGGGFLVAAGVGIMMAGVTTLLTRPPKFEDFRDIDNGGRVSYLYNGPENIVGEGGPVPVGYGRMIVGSQVISSALVNREYRTLQTNVTLYDPYTYDEFPYSPSQYFPDGTKVTTLTLKGRLGIA